MRRDQGPAKKEQINVRLSEEDFKLFTSYADARAWPDGQLGRMIIEKWIALVKETGVDPIGVAPVFDTQAAAPRTRGKSGVFKKVVASR